jgi:hypothetical protein
MGEVEPGGLVWFASKTTKPLERPQNAEVARFTASHLYLVLVVL